LEFETCAVFAYGLGLKLDMRKHVPPERALPRVQFLPPAARLFAPTGVQKAIPPNREKSVAGPRFAR
jgi:hypothetical protein